MARTRPTKRRFRYSTLARLAVSLSRATAHPLAYVVMAGVALAWMVVGPFMNFSFQWLNAFWVLTMVVTFVLVFIVQHTQYRELTAIQLKLNELIRSTGGAHNSLLDVEALTDGELDGVRTAYHELARKARTHLADGEDAAATEVVGVGLAYLLEVAPVAVSDPARLAALADLGVVGTPREARFDRLTALACKMVGAPVALISLVTSDSQFFKSACGIESDGTPLSHSFCQFAVASGEPLIITNARTHPLVHDNPAIQDLGVEAYCGLPLITREGRAIGSFCVIDHRPREWSTQHVRSLAHLAAIVMLELELEPQSVSRGPRSLGQARLSLDPIDRALAGAPASAG